MSDSEQAPPPARRRRSTTAVVLALAVAATIGSALGCQAVATPSSAAAPPLGATESDGVVPDGVTVFDDEYPAVADLDPELLDAVRRAATAAADDGVQFTVTSGWRSAAYQDQLLREAVSEYGSVQEAARWVATPETSLHVSGDAIDLGHSAATSWLSEHGAGYGLCRVYRNEPWHYELRPGAVEHGCPTPYVDPTHDPRLQR
jgi:zinc D-Ala-D-Ala carboxypeptidase